ncbi:MAG: hypothetical protein M3N52_08105 [Actinomycetota bacterium]|nr:hypothetical protein [Actinomycetota bacterium]
MKTKTRSLALLVMTAALLFAGLPATGHDAPPDQGRGGLRGDFSLVAMVHTTAYEDQELGEQFPNPWEGSEQGGPFRYASVPCTRNAPVNNISTNLTTYNSRLPGSRSPASTRNHPLEFTVTDSRLDGSITLTVCKLGPGPTTSPDPVADADKDKIFFSWHAHSHKTSPEEVSWTGTFRITGGTGVYQDLRGGGRIAGYFFCFATEGCATLGEFRDGQYTMVGRYNDPTVPTG